MVCSKCQICEHKARLVLVFLGAINDDRSNFSLMKYCTMAVLKLCSESFLKLILYLSFQNLLLNFEEVYLFRIAFMNFMLSILLSFLNCFIDTFYAT